MRDELPLLLVWCFDWSGLNMYRQCPLFFLLNVGELRFVEKCQPPGQITTTRPFFQALNALYEGLCVQ